MAMPKKKRTRKRLPEPIVNVAIMSKLSGEGDITDTRFGIIPTKSGPTWPATATHIHRDSRML
jgi:hypothetical protein